MMSAVKNNILLGAFALLVLAMPAKATDVAVVLDDSKGMCGYLDAPFSKNRYKKTLNILEGARSASGLDVQVYFLSNLRHSQGNAGSTFDKVVNLNAENCTKTYKAPISLLHGALGNVGSASATVLVTDLLFDAGAGGSSDSRNAFVTAIDNLAQRGSASKEKWFNTSAGIVGIISPYSGEYWTAIDNRMVKLASQERPFYLVWQTSDQNKFAKFLDALKDPLWKFQAENDAAEKPKVKTEKGRSAQIPPGVTETVRGDMFAMTLLPVAAMVPQNAGFTVSLPKPWHSTVGIPTFFYAQQNALKPNEPRVLNSNDMKREMINPTECFSSTQSPFVLQYSQACGENGAKESFFYQKDIIKAIHVLYPINEIPRGIARQLTATSRQGQPYSNLVRASFHQNLSVSPYFVLPKNTQSVLVFELYPIRASNSIFRGKVKGSQGQSKGPFVFSVKESYSAVGFTEADYKTIESWSSEEEPCGLSNCVSNNRNTLHLGALLRALVDRLGSNAKAAELLNRSTDQGTVSPEISLTVTERR